MPKPIPVKIPYGVLEAKPHMTEAEFAQVRAEIRSRYYVSTNAATRPALPTAPPAVEPPQPQQQPPTEERATQSSTAPPDPPRPAATRSDKPSGNEAAREEWC